MKFNIADKFSASGVATPLSESAASGSSKLDQEQRSAIIGEVIPIVFCRRIGNVGGAFISPPATECAFSNSQENDVTASYLVVLSEGEIDGIQVRDVFQGRCRVGTFTQTYNQRAGTFTAGNSMTDIFTADAQFSFQPSSSPEPWTWYNATEDIKPGGYRAWLYILDGVTYKLGLNSFPAINSVRQVRYGLGGVTEKPEATTYCGTGGTYEKMSTLAFTVTYPNGYDGWKKQIHCFVRGGLHVTRLLDNVYGPSNNVADLFRFLLANSSKINSGQIDTSSLIEAARFADTNEFWFNGTLADSVNLRDWMSKTLPYFLLRSTRINGKEALRPLVPYVAATGAINTDAVSWVFTFTEEHIVPGGFQISYMPLADRKPFCILVLWRQQPTDDIGLIRSTEVRYVGTAVDGPFEQHDLSSFCTSENHAVKAGAYILARRKHITHTLNITAKPDVFNKSLTTGDLVRVLLERTPSTGASSTHDGIYEVDQISKNLSGEVELALTEFPVDDDLRSIVALDVASAVGNGILMPTSKNGASCDANSATDTSVPESIGSSTEDTGAVDADGDPVEIDWENDQSVDEMSSASVTNHAPRRQGPFRFYGNILKKEQDKIASNTPVAPIGSGGLIYSGSSEIPKVGDTVQPSTYCEGGRVTWYRLDPSAPGGKNFLTQGSSTYTMVINDVDYSVYSEVECPDPASPTGYGPAIPLGQTGRIYPAPALPDANVYGTYSPTDWTFVEVQSGVQWSGSKLVNSVCTAQTSSGGSGSGNFKGIKGMRLVKTGGPGTCGGYLTIALQIQNAAGTWSQIASIGGGGTDWISFVGSINMSSSAPDAIPAYLGNFGGTSNPP